MKAVHVVRQFFPSIGGLESAVLELCRALAPQGVATRVVTLDRISSGAVPGRLPERDEVGGVSVERIPFRGSWRYPLAPSVLGHLRDADVVHVHGIDFFFDFLAATRPIHGKPLVASTHGGFFHTAFAQRLKRAYFQTATRAASRAYRAILASSESDFDLFRSVAGRRLVLAPNGVDVRKWAGRGSTRPVRRLIFIGRFSSNKNIGALIPLVAALRVHDPEWSLTIAGQPWDVSAGSLQAIARQAGVSEAVTILPAPDDAAIGAAIAGASYIVSASRHEGFGLSIVEGLSAGLMPVLSPIPPFARLVSDAHLGCLTDFADPAASAAAIENLHRDLLADPARLRGAAMAAAARYSWATAADVVRGTYERILDRRSPPVPATPLRSMP